MPYVPRFTRPLLLAAAAALAIPGVATTSGEVRALWVTRARLVTPAAIAAVVKTASETGFNTLIVQVRARGDAYFNDGVEPRAVSLASQPDGFDPLAAAIAAARPLGLAVHAWVSIGLVSSAVDLPSDRGHIVVRHPEWLMVPRAIARELLLTDPATQLYSDKLARWSRTASGEVEGLYLSPIPSGAADHTVEVVADIAARYAIDGVHLDYARYPTDEFDFSREALLAFDSWLIDHAGNAGTDRPPARLASQLLADVEQAPDAWREFRRERLTQLVGRIHRAVRARRPEAVVSVAVVPDAREAAARRLQDWSGWLDREVVDVVCPMAYGVDVPTFTTQLSGASQVAAGRPMWAGIGAYRIPASQAAEHIRIARQLGASGIALFSYDALGGTAGPAEYLSEVAQAAFVR